jgi:hypothetical protein
MVRSLTNDPARIQLKTASNLNIAFFQLALVVQSIFSVRLTPSQPLPIPGQSDSLQAVSWWNVPKPRQAVNAQAHHLCATADNAAAKPWTISPLLPLIAFILRKCPASVVIR